MLGIGGNAKTFVILGPQAQSFHPSPHGAFTHAKPLRSKRLGDRRRARSLLTMGLLNAMSE